MKEKILILIYLVAIIIANNLITFFGPSLSIVTAFVFIGLDLTVRDLLHDKWGDNNLWVKMVSLILIGSLLSMIVNYDSKNIAIASFFAFFLSGLVDTIIYQLLKKNSKFYRINGSNIFSSMTDSLVFPILAFGFPVLWFIVIGQFIAKTVGGFVWYFVFRIIKNGS